MKQERTRQPNNLNEGRGDSDSGAHLFLLGADYHLGDLMWLTAVLREYRRVLAPDLLALGCPDRPISRVLEQNPFIDELLYGDPAQIFAQARVRLGRHLVVRDLRPLSFAKSMLQDWRRRPPWLYYRDLWLQERGQWLATFLNLGRMQQFRPVLRLVEADRAEANRLRRPYVVLAPHIGQYVWSALAAVWRRLKAWPWEHWQQLAQRLRREGFEPVTLAAGNQAGIPGTRPLLGLPIRQVAGVIEGAAALVSGESGLWFLAAACETPFVIVPWWLPRSVNWAAPMRVPHRLVYGHDAAVHLVFSKLSEMIVHDGNVEPAGCHLR